MRDELPARVFRAQPGRVPYIMKNFDVIAGSDDWGSDDWGSDDSLLQSDKYQGERS